MVGPRGAVRPVVLLSILLASSRSAAQDERPDSSISRAQSGLIIPGSSTDQWVRTEQLLGLRPAGGYLLRSPSALVGPDAGVQTRDGGELLLPEIRLGRNSELPRSLSEAGHWSGRGWNAAITGGARVRIGRVSITLAPTLSYHENLAYQILPAKRAGRDTLASHWYSGNISIDLPQRFGEDPYLVSDWGQSSVALQTENVAVGIGTESQWWGPGIRNALVISSNASGIPHLFVRTAKPVRTALGEMEGKWLLGALSESGYFDTLSTNDRRSYAAAVLTFSPAAEPNLTVGLARAVYGPLSRLIDLPRHALDPFVSFYARHGERVDAAEARGARDQVTSVFARWVLPKSGFESYAEVAYQELPRTVRDILTDPGHSRGVTLGAQWAKPMGGGLLRVQPEITHLEQSSSFTQRPVPTFYVSRMVKQGYTQRGQVIGAGIGPGSSMQWLSIDYLTRSWHAGVFSGRTRWNNDAYYHSEPNLSYAHDVSMIGGLRAGRRLGLLEWEVQLGVEKRYNYLFQNRSPGFEGQQAVDILNRVFRLNVHPVISPGRWREGIRR